MKIMRRGTGKHRPYNLIVCDKLTECELKKCIALTAQGSSGEFVPSLSDQRRARLRGSDAGMRTTANDTQRYSIARLAFRVAKQEASGPALKEGHRVWLEMGSGNGTCAARSMMCMLVRDNSGLRCSESS